MLNSYKFLYHKILCFWMADGKLSNIDSNAAHMSTMVTYLVTFASFVFVNY